MNNTVIASWEKNADEWIKVVDAGKIASRAFTNEAIVGVLKRSAANKILDVGCGEGWLTRSITRMGKEAVGIDVVEKLLENARGKGPEQYYRMGYGDIAIGQPIPEAPYDMAVFNFCLYQNEGLAELLEKTKNALVDDGRIVIQTLHPYFLIQNGLGYKSQAIADSWKGLPGDFTDAHSWYARTIEDWVSVFSRCNLQLKNLHEIQNDKQDLISVIFSLGS